jgi:hypothetical protein
MNIFLRSDVMLLLTIFSEFIKVSVVEKGKILFS